MTVLLFRSPGSPALQTLQPKTRRALDFLKATIADDAVLSRSVRFLSPLKLTDELMQDVLTKYYAHATISPIKP